MAFDSGQVNVHTYLLAHNEENINACIGLVQKRKEMSNTSAYFFSDIIGTNQTVFGNTINRILTRTAVSERHQFAVGLPLEGTSGPGAFDLNALLDIDGHDGADGIPQTVVEAAWNV